MRNRSFSISIPAASHPLDFQILRHPVAHLQQVGTHCIGIGLRREETLDNKLFVVKIGEEEVSGERPKAPLPFYQYTVHNHHGIVDQHTHCHNISCLQISRFSTAAICCTLRAYCSKSRLIILFNKGTTLFIIQIGIFALEKQHEAMPQDSTLNTLNLNMLSFNERTCTYRNELFLADNFDTPNHIPDLLNNPEVLAFISSPYPFKVQLARR